MAAKTVNYGSHPRPHARGARTEGATMLQEPPLQGDEATTLCSFLDYHRAMLREKCEDLTAEQLNRTLPPSDMTLGGMLKHLAVVESSWFSEDLLGEPLIPPFD